MSILQMKRWGGVSPFKRLVQKDGYVSIGTRIRTSLYLLLKLVTFH